MSAADPERQMADSLDMFAGQPLESETKLQSATQGKRSNSELDDTEQVVKKKPCHVYLSLKGFFAERQGEREDMEDAHVILENYQKDVPHLHSSMSRLAYFGVYDGHAGPRAAQFCATHLHKTIANKFPKGDLKQTEKEMKRCFIDSFKETDKEFLKQASKQKPSWKDGTTAISAIAINNTLYVANVGDSKALLCRYSDAMKKHLAIPLSKDHSPSLYDERIRIQKAGGCVKDGRVMGVIEVSRSIGDGPYKKHGVICVPEMKRCQLTPDDRYVIIACDGLWKSFTSESAIAFVNNVLKDETIEATEFRTRTEMCYDTACQRIASEAVLRLSADNVTVLIIAIDNWIP